MGRDGLHAPSGQLANTVYSRLEEMISSGEFGENSRLPSEANLAKQFQVSRPILRQALERLRTKGRIISRQGSGSFVLRRSNANLLDYGPLRNIHDFRKCLEFRRGLECEAAREAASRHSETNSREIIRAIQAQQQAIKFGGDGIEEDFAFHLAIAQATENRFYVITLEALRTQTIFGINLVRSLSPMPGIEHMKNVEFEHSQILEAIQRQAPDAAANAMTAHLGKGLGRIFDPS